MEKVIYVKIEDQYSEPEKTINEYLKKGWRVKKFKLIPVEGNHPYILGCFILLKPKNEILNPQNKNYSE